MFFYVRNLAFAVIGRFFIITAAAILWPSFSLGVEEIALGDDFGFTESIGSVSKDRRVIEMRTHVRELQRKIERLKAPEIKRLFGKPITKPEKKYALSIGQDPIIGLSGLRESDPKKNKDHVAFYAIDDYAGIEIYYGIDGITPGAAVLYFTVDKAFVRISKDTVGKRLEWEQGRFKKLSAAIEAKLTDAKPKAKGSLGRAGAVKDLSLRQHSGRPRVPCVVRELEKFRS